LKGLKQVDRSDKRSLALIAKKGADFEKAYNEAEELLDKQIEATYKLFEENKELKEKAKVMSETLSKATELLKDITSSYGSTEVSESQLYLKIKRAEQFISEVEK
jgi:hypothetical protein